MFVQPERSSGYYYSYYRGIYFHMDYGKNASLKSADLLFAGTPMHLKGTAGITDAAYTFDLDLTADRISVKDRISELVDMFEKKESLTFEELFSEHPGRTEVIVTFLAILEMVKLALIRLAQHSQTGVIRLFYQ